MHYSRLTQAERQAAREARRQSVGMPNKHGGVSFFRQGGNGKSPTSEETAAAVRFGRGDDAPERQPHTVVRFGPDFSKVIGD